MRKLNQDFKNFQAENVDTLCKQFVDLYKLRGFLVNACWINNSLFSFKGIYYQKYSLFLLFYFII